MCKDFHEDALYVWFFKIKTYAMEVLFICFEFQYLSNGSVVMLFIVFPLNRVVFLVEQAIFDAVCLQ